MENLRHFLSSTVSESDLQKVIDHLTLLGAECLEDLRFLDAEKELIDVLPLLKRRCLNASLKAEFGFTTGRFCISGCLNVI
jgi:hypothetical protein